MSLVDTMKKLKIGEKIMNLAKTKTAIAGAAIVANAVWANLTGQPSFSDAAIQQVLGLVQGVDPTNTDLIKTISGLIKGKVADADALFQVLMGGGLIASRYAGVKQTLALNTTLARLEALMGSRTQGDITSGGSTSPDQ